jgi:hypothetical protein
MKKLITLLLVAVLGVCSPVLLTSCSTAPSSRVTQVQTLKAVGESAEAVVTSAAHLYASGQITAAQTLQITHFYDFTFQPAYRVAVTAVNSNLTLQAPDDLIALSAQLSALLLQFTTQK